MKNEKEVTSPEDMLMTNELHVKPNKSQIKEMCAQILSKTEASDNMLNKIKSSFS